LTWDDLNHGLGNRMNRRGEHAIDASNVDHGLGNRLNRRGERAIDASDLTRAGRKR